MAKKKHVIIGCGTAGLAAVKEIRRLAPEDEIIMITKESHLPYSLAALPYLVSGKVKESDLWLVDEDYLSKMGCILLRDKEVSEIHPEKKRLNYKDGGSTSYDTLLIASGSQPARTDISGLEQVSPLYFHTLEDYELLRQRLINKEDVVIYGAGLVAIELAVALLEANHRVKIVVRSRVLRLYFDQIAGNMIENMLIARGAQIYKGQVIDEVGKSKEKIEIILSDGTHLDADIMVIALGVKPATSFLAGSGIELSDGVIADRSLRTNIKDVYVAGDVAETHNFFTGQLGVSPILPSAIEQGKIASSNMAGEKCEYAGWIPSNMFNFFGNTAFSVGLSMPIDNGFQTLTERDNKKMQLKKLVYDGDKLVGGMFLNVDVNLGLMLYLIKKRVDIGAYKQMLFEQPKEISRWLVLETEHREAHSIR
jgi:phenylglyoxylate dehydrogenase epsilon subunit